MKNNILVIGSNYGKNVICFALKKKKDIKNIYLQNSSQIFFDYLQKKKIGKCKLSNFILNYNIDIVILAVPPQYQINYAKKILKFKKLPILFEKPLGKNKIQVLNLKNFLGKTVGNHSIDFNFLTVRPFQFLMKKYLIKNKFRKISIKWLIPKRHKANWKNNRNLGGGLVKNFLIHIISVFVYCFDKIKVLDKSKKNNIYLLLNNKTSVDISFEYSKNKKNCFILKIMYPRYQLIMENKTNHYHSGYSFYKKNNNQRKKILLKKFLKEKNDRIVPFIRIFTNFINFLNNKDKNKYSLKLGFKCHEILDKISN
jgi:predicted dehydrogenase